MGEIFDMLLARPMGFIMDTSYQLIPSYLVSILVLTLIIKLLMYPLGVRTQKSQLKQMRVKPREAEIRKKYANEKEKMNSEVMALYKAEGVSMTGGCLPMLLQLPLIWALYNVINRPLTFIMHYTADTMAKLSEIFGQGFSEINIARSIPNMMSGVMDKVASAVAHPLPSDMATGVVTKVQETAASLKAILPPDVKTIDFNMFGVSLADTPSLNVLNALWLIPILSAGMALLQMLYTTKNNPMTLANELLKSGEPVKQPGGKFMMLLSPLLSLWIAFTLPAAIGTYWTISGALSLFQSWLLNRLYDPHKALQEIKEEMARAPKKKKKKKKVIAESTVVEDDIYDASPDRVRLAPVNPDDDDMYDASPDRVRIAPKKKSLPPPMPEPEPDEDEDEYEDDDGDDTANDNGKEH